MVQRKKIGMWVAVLTVAVLMPPVLMFPQNGKSQKMPSLKLRLKPGKLVNGIPESFTFVFVNISNHDVRMPQPSNCHIATTGTLLLSELAPPPPSGVGGGCAGGTSDLPPMLDQAKDWKVLKPGELLKISFTRSELFSYQQASGTYEFWAECSPPEIPVEDQRILTEEGIDFPRSHLVSPHPIFVRKK